MSLLSRSTAREMASGESYQRVGPLLDARMALRRSAGVGPCLWRGSAQDPERWVPDQPPVSVAHLEQLRTIITAAGVFAGTNIDDIML